MGPFREFLACQDERCFVRYRFCDTWKDGKRCQLFFVSVCSTFCRLFSAINHVTGGYNITVMFTIAVENCLKYFLLTFLLTSPEL